MSNWGWTRPLLRTKIVIRSLRFRTAFALPHRMLCNSATVGAKPPTNSFPPDNPPDELGHALLPPRLPTLCERTPGERYLTLASGLSSSTTEKGPNHRSQTSHDPQTTPQRHSWASSTTHHTFALKNNPRETKRKRNAHHASYHFPTTHHSHPPATTTNPPEQSATTSNKTPPDNA